MSTYIDWWSWHKDKWRHDRRRHSTPRTVYNPFYIVPSLSPEITTEVRDLILTPPAGQPYDTLKEQLVNRSAACEQWQLQQFFSAEELEDHKCSQLLHRMQSWTTATIGWFLHLWAVVPTSPFQCLHGSHLHSVFLKGLAQSADRQSRLPLLLSQQWPFPTSLPRLNIFAPRWTNHQTDLVQSFLQQKSLPQSVTQPTQLSFLYWYHCHFGDGACKCEVPCSKVGTALASC